MLLTTRYGRKVIPSVYIVLTAGFFFTAQPAAFAQSPVIDLPHGKITAGALIDSIDKKIPVSWNSDELDSTRYLNVDGPALLVIALHELTDPLHLCFKIVSDTQVFIELKKPPIDSMSCMVSVSDQAGELLPSASLQDVVTKRVYYCNTRGIAIIRIPRKTLILDVSYVGMTDDTITFLGSGIQDVHLQRKNSCLDEELVNGYVDVKRRYLPGSRDKIDREKLDGAASLPLPMALEGKVAGLLVTRTSGMPGSSSYITLRGQGSLYNDCTPLIVIDGTIYVAGNKSMLNLFVSNSGGSIDPLTLVTQGDIESIEVLKDADATAIYGSRGANGVILITTRHSKTRATQGHLQILTGFGQVARRLPMMNTQQYLAMRHDGFRNDQPAVAMTPANAADILVWDTTRYTDWSRYFLGGLSHMNSLHGSLAGGNGHNNYYVGVGGLHETTVFPNHSPHERLDGNLNLDHHSANEKYLLGLSGLFAIDRNDQIITYDPTGFAVLAPDAPALRNPDGGLNFGPAADSSWVNSWINPQSLLERPYHAVSHSYLVSATTQYRIRPWLVLKTDAGFNNVGDHESGYAPLSVQDPATPGIDTSYVAHTAYTGWQIEPQLEIRKKIGRLSVSNLDGFSWQRITANTYSNPQSDSVIPTNYNYRAFFSRFSLNYDNTYLLDLTGRLDGTNRFGPGIKYAPFYAVGTSWLFSELSAHRHALRFLSYGKLGVNAGITGNDQIGDHQESGYAPTNAPRFFNIPGFFSSNQVAAGASWETILKEEIVLDLGFVHDRYLLTVAWYNHQSKDQLLPMSFPIPGTPDVFENWPAVVRNRGWEFTVSARIMEKRDFSWTLDLNWSLSENRLVSFRGLAQTPFAHTFVVGRSIDVVQGWHYTGVDSQKGIFTFVGRNHESVLSDSNKLVTGHLDPRGFGGISSSICYKRFRVDILCDARSITGSSYLTTFYTNNPPGSLLSGFYSNAPVQLMARWEKPGDHAAYQQVVTDTTGQVGAAMRHFTASDAGLANASFFRLKKLALSYTIPAAVWGAPHGSGVTLFIEGQDLLTLSPYKHVDPEIQSATVLPPLRIVEVGIRLAF